jgi:HPt (histidine-containing phosphotransfer) domain-containing protein
MTELQSALDNAVLDALRESVGDDPEFLAELIDTFVADAPDQLESLRVSAASGDTGGARRAAHTLKGNGLTFGAREFASLCQAAESAAGAGDLEAVLAQVGGIDHEWRRVQAELLAVRDGR